MISGSVRIPGKIEVAILVPAASPVRDLLSVLAVVKRPDRRDESGSAASGGENNADIRGVRHGGHVTERVRLWHAVDAGQDETHVPRPARDERPNVAMPAASRPGRGAARSANPSATTTRPRTTDAACAPGLTSASVLLKEIQGISEPRTTAVPPAMASTASWAFGDMAGRSSTHSCHPGGGAGQEGSGCQPGGATHPAGAGGQPGGGLNRVVPTVLSPASPWVPAVASERRRSRPVPPVSVSPAVRNSLPHRLTRSKSFF